MTAPNESVGNKRRIRVVIQQPALPAYRISVFRELSHVPGLDLVVVYGSDPALPNAEPDGFCAKFFRLYSSRLFGLPVFWHSPQFEFATHEKADVLVLVWNVQYLTLFPALLRARCSGVATVLWGHGYSKREKSWKRWVRMLAGRLADSILLYDQRTAMRLVEEHRISSDRCFVAPNSLDQSKISDAKCYWESNSQELRKFRENVGVDGRKVILFVSRLDPQNRLDLLIRAIVEMGNVSANTEVVVIGGGDSERNRLASLAMESGVSRHFRFLGAIYDEREIAKWFLSASVFCYPENIGLSVLHAFGYGVPAITSNRVESQNPEVVAIIDGENGLLYNDGDAVDLAAKLCCVLQNDDLRSRLSSNALETATERYSIGRMVNGMKEAIDHAAKRRGRL